MRGKFILILGIVLFLFPLVVTGEEIGDCEALGTSWKVGKCYHDMAILIEDVELCDSASNHAGHCYYQLAILTEDSNLCNLANKFESECLYDLSMKQNDSSYYTNTGKDKLLAQMAMDTGNASYCLTLPDKEGCVWKVYQEHENREVCIYLDEHKEECMCDQEEFLQGDKCVDLGCKDNEGYENHACYKLKCGEGMEAVNHTCATTCSESDGRDYEKAGTTKGFTQGGSFRDFEDNCKKETILQEYSCDGRALRNEDIYCSEYCAGQGYEYGMCGEGDGYCSCFDDESKKCYFNHNKRVRTNCYANSSGFQIFTYLFMGIILIGGGYLASRLIKKKARPLKNIEMWLLLLFTAIMTGIFWLFLRPNWLISGQNKFPIRQLYIFSIIFIVLFTYVINNFAVSYIKDRKKKRSLLSFILVSCIGSFIMFTTLSIVITFVSVIPSILALGEYRGLSGLPLTLIYLLFPSAIYGGLNGIFVGLASEFSILNKFKKAAKRYKNFKLIISSAVLTPLILLSLAYMIYKDQLIHRQFPPAMYIDPYILFYGSTIITIFILSIIINSLLMYYFSDKNTKHQTLLCIAMTIIFFIIFSITFSTTFEYINTYEERKIQDILTEAVQSNNVSFCYQLEPGGQQNQCINDIALNTSNYELCIGEDCKYQIVSRQSNPDMCNLLDSMKNQCFTEFADKLNDTDICESVNESTAKDQCLYNVVIKQEDHTSCYYITQTKKEEECINYIYCHGEDNMCYPDPNKEYKARIREIVKSGSLEDCKALPRLSEEFCYFEFAMKQQDISLCNNLNYKWEGWNHREYILKEECSVSVAILSRNISLCQFAGQYNDSCIEQINNDKGLIDLGKNPIYRVDIYQNANVFGEYGHFHVENTGGNYLYSGRFRILTGGIPHSIGCYRPGLIMPGTTCTLTFYFEGALGGKLGPGVHYLTDEEINAKE